MDARRTRRISLFNDDLPQHQKINVPQHGAQEKSITLSLTWSRFWRPDSSLSHEGVDKGRNGTIEFHWIGSGICLRVGAQKEEGSSSALLARPKEGSLPWRFHPVGGFQVRGMEGYLGPFSQGESRRQSITLTASELYCPKCRKASPVREKLLLVLPDGELHEYICAVCGTSVGERKTRESKDVRILLP